MIKSEKVFIISYLVTETQLNELNARIESGADFRPKPCYELVMVSDSIKIQTREEWKTLAENLSVAFFRKAKEFGELCFESKLAAK